MTQTLVHAHSQPDAPKGTPTRALSEEYHARAWQNDFAANGRAAYRAHNDAVREAARRDGRALLEYDVAQGWAPLCELLGVDVPEGAFPRDDAWKEYKAHHFPSS
jgi:hypothetical protein